MKKVLFIFLVLMISVLYIGCKAEVVVKYLVRFYNGSEVVQELEVTKDDKLEYPELNQEEGYYYEWDKKLPEKIDSDMIFTATLKARKKKYTFIVDGEIVSSKVINFLDKVEYPKYDDIEDGVLKYVWEDTLVEEKDSEVVYESHLTRVWKKFTVKFTDYKNNVFKEEEVEYGKSATLPILEDEYAWSSLEYQYVTRDLVIKGKKIGETYNIKYFDADGTVLDLEPKTYKSGIGATLPTPEKDGYYFIGWFVSTISLYPYTVVSDDSFGDINLYARFLETEVHNPIVLPDATAHFSSINSFPHSLNPNTTVFQPILPAGVPSGNTNYDWSSSDESVATISQYSSITGKKAGVCIITGVNKSNSSITVNGLIRVTGEGVVGITESEANVIDVCTVRFLDKDGNLIKTAKVLKGGSTVYPIPPAVEGYRFTGWDKPNYNIKVDTDITAKYKKGESKYLGKKFSIIGDSISTYQDFIPKGYACFYPYPTADVYDVNMTWWMMTINRLGGGLFINNSYSGSCAASSTGTSASSDINRLKKLVVGEERPDVIIIYMGSNDCGSKYVSEAEFKSGYEETITKTQSLCPEAEILLCTLPVSNLYTNDNRVIYNNDIRILAAKYNLKVIDLAEVDLTNDLVDSAHPLTSGMKLIADEIVSQLTK